MLYIQAQNVSFGYLDSYKTILKNISFKFSKNQKVGLIGKNGCGKSTLLKIISQELKPQEGTLFFKDNLKIGYLSQEIKTDENLTVMEYLWNSFSELKNLREKINRIESGVYDFTDLEIAEIYSQYQEKDGYFFEAEIEKTLCEFGFNNRFSEKINSLSGGEKTKIALASIILNNPDILLLDEPSNHLDRNNLEWLENYLQNLDKSYILISHDRKFLDNCTNMIWELQEDINVYSGNYSFYKQQKELELERKILEYELQQKKVKQLETASQKKHDEGISFENFKQSRSVKKNGGLCARDEGSGSARLNISKIMKSAKAVENRIDKLLQEEKSKKPVLEKNRKLIIPESDINTKWVLEVNNLSKSFDEKSIFENININIENGVKVAITGQNGSGKSTFLNIIAGKIKEYSGNFRWSPQAKIAYYSQQHENLNPNNSIIEEVLAGKTDQTLARTILGSMNIQGDKVYQSIATLSPGERSKTLLAKIIFSGANVLILDEPTNHLEIYAMEAFENALSEFKGTVIVVSHDRYFLEKIVDYQFKIDKEFCYNSLNY